MPTINKGRETRGRPKSDIDWEKVDALLEAGCLGTEVAAFIGVSTYTLYDRCLIDNGVLYSQYSQEKQSKGESILRKAQFDKALSGDTTLMIWLGKCRLKQIDASQIAAAEAGKANYNIVTDAKGLAAGIPAEKLSNTDNQSAK